MRKQDSAHADSGQKRSLYRRAHETSPDLRSSETGIGRAWEIPFLASETLTAFTRTACCFIGRFCEQGSAQSVVRLASPVLCFFTTLASRRISTLCFPGVLESQLTRTTRWNLQRECSATPSRRAQEKSLNASNEHRMRQVWIQTSPGYRNHRLPLLFTRTALLPYSDYL